MAARPLPDLLNRRGMDMEDIIRALEDYFEEYGRERSMEYIYGYMDALAVLRGLDTNRQNQRERRDTLRP